MDWSTTYPFPTIDKRWSHIVGGAATNGNVTIGSDVWVGFNALILSGVTVGHGAVVGAYAVVTKDVPPYAIVAGNPARIVRTRFSPEIIERFLRIAWWNWPAERVDRAVPLLTSADVEAFLRAAEEGKV